MEASDTTSNTTFWKSYARALGGALIFSFPLLMTMEMWRLGMYLDRLRLALLLLLLMPLLFGVARFSGFRSAETRLDYLIDALVALTAGALVSAAFLGLFGLLGPSMSIDEILGKVALLSVPAGMGAIIASKRLGSGSQNEGSDPQTWQGEIFIMGAGALFLAFNVAPTEEMVLIAYKMTLWHSLALMLASLLIMHLLVYKLEFKGQHDSLERNSLLATAFYFTVSGYALALLISAYILWTFGRLDGLGLTAAAATCVVLGFPAALGAATARLVI